jgi:hypothetical protein
MTAEDITDGLRSLKEEDFDYSNPKMNGPDVLRQLTNAIVKFSDPQVFVSELFSVMERLPTSELGSPGPLVHTLESIPGYEKELIRSVHRLPTVLSVWMVNRLLNTMLSDDDRTKYLSLLQDAMANMRATESTRIDASKFLELQLGKRGSSIQ